jgi:hypothetical protein
MKPPLIWPSIVDLSRIESTTIQFETKYYSVLVFFSSTKRGKHHLFALRFAFITQVASIVSFESNSAGHHP